MKTQEQIKFENTYTKLSISPYKQYSTIPNSTGQILHYLYGYNFLRYDTVQVGNFTVYDRGEELATFKMEKSFPVFTFNPKYKYIREIQDNYLEMLNTIY